MKNQASKVTITPGPEGMRVVLEAKGDGQLFREASVVPLGPGSGKAAAEWVLAKLKELGFIEVPKTSGLRS